MNLTIQKTLHIFQVQLVKLFIINFINNPQAYLTTVGLYNDANELLAVAKLSKPLNKNFTKEALIRVKLDF